MTTLLGSAPCSYSSFRRPQPSAGFARESNLLRTSTLPTLWKNTGALFVQTSIVNAKQRKNNKEEQFTGTDFSNVTTQFRARGIFIRFEFCIWTQEQVTKIIKTDNYRRLPAPTSIPNDMMQNFSLYKIVPKMDTRYIKKHAWLYISVASH